MIGEKYFNQWTGEKCRVSILISDKIEFKTKAIKRESEEHLIILKVRIHQENLNIVNIHTQHRSTQIYKENLGELQETYRQ